MDSKIRLYIIGIIVASILVLTGAFMKIMLWKYHNLVLNTGLILEMMIGFLLLIHAIKKRKDDTKR